jgi:hypothetical protein
MQTASEKQKVMLKTMQTMIRRVNFTSVNYLSGSNTTHVFEVTKNVPIIP